VLGCLVLVLGVWVCVWICCVCAAAAVLVSVSMGTGLALTASPPLTPTQPVFEYRGLYENIQAGKTYRQEEGTGWQPGIWRTFRLPVAQWHWTVDSGHTATPAKRLSHT